MKTHRFELGRFFPSEGDELDSIHIDWPCIHRQTGKDQIQWLKAQDPSECQMVVEQRPNDSHWWLVAEIYTDRLATAYALMWAK